MSIQNTHGTKLSIATVIAHWPRSCTNRGIKP